MHIMHRFLYIVICMCTHTCITQYLPILAHYIALHIHRILMKNKYTSNGAERF